MASTSPRHHQPPASPMAGARAAVLLYQRPPVLAGTSPPIATRFRGRDRLSRRAGVLFAPSNSSLPPPHGRAEEVRGRSPRRPRPPVGETACITTFNCGPWLAELILIAGRCRRDRAPCSPGPVRCPVCCLPPASPCSPARRGSRHRLRRSALRDAGDDRPGLILFGGGYRRLEGSGRAGDGGSRATLGTALTALCLLRCERSRPSAAGKA